MTWYWYVIVAAVLSSIGQLTRKKALIHEHALEFNSFRGYITLPILFIYAFFVPLSISIVDITFLVVLAGITVAGLLLSSRAFRHGSISEMGPLTGIAPVFVLLLAAIFLSEIPTLIQVTGIFICVFGVYVLKFEHKGWLDPFKKLAEAPPRRMMFALVLFTMSTVGLREILQQVNPFTVMLYYWLFICLLAIFIEWTMHGFHDIKDFKKEAAPIIISAVAFFVANLLNAIALSFPLAKAALVQTLSGVSILFVTFIGGKMYREKNLVRKSIASLIIVGGVLLMFL